MAELYCPVCGSGSMQRKGYRQIAGENVQNYICKDCKKQTCYPDEEEAPPPTEFQTELPKSEVYFITAAQNSTPVFKKNLQAAENFCKENGAKLIVIPFRYKNPTSVWTRQQENQERWDDLLEDYLYWTRSPINSNLMLLGDIRVQATGQQPLSGFESITKHCSGIIGHPKRQFKCIPTPSSKEPKIMCTTGAVTHPNYTDTKAGAQGEFHHIFGGLVVEVQDNKVFHMRQVHALRKDGSFIHLDKKYSHKGVTKAPRPLGLVMGDTHVDYVDPDVVCATFTNEDSIVNTLRPRALYWNDLLDFYAQNHHHRGNPFVNLAKHRSGRNNVREEVERACAFVDHHSPAYCTNYLLPGNHPDALMRWVKEADWKGDPENAEFYLETALALVRSTRATDTGSHTDDPFNYWAKQLIQCADRTEFPSRNEAVHVGGMEVFHGDHGPNGARGSINGFKRIGTRSIIAHLHTPGIEEGCTQVGTSTRKGLEYVSGPSSWMHSHALINGDSTVTLLNIIRGDWKI